MQDVLQTFRGYLEGRRDDLLRDWLAGFDWALPGRGLAPAPAPALRHLGEAAAQAGAAEAALVQCFADHAARLHWRRSYTPDDFGPYFFENYAFVELFGLRGHFACDHMAGGLILFGPGLDYPNHWHVAEEIYLPLGDGGLWSRDSGPHRPRASGELVFHASNMPHAIRTQATAMLALWLWRGGDLAQKSAY